VIEDPFAARRGLLFTIAYEMLGSAADAEDVLQTVWERLVAHLGDIHNSAALSSWLVTTTRREAWRVRAAQRKQPAADQELLTELPDQAPGSEEQVIMDDQRRALWEAIGRLSSRCQELLRIVAFAPRPETTEYAYEA